MSVIKWSVFIWISIVIHSCGAPSVGKYDDLTIVERDSIAERFNDLANRFWQPTEGYRRYKDSAILVSPADIGYRQTLSYAYKKRGEHIQAMETLNKAVQMDIDNGSFAALEYRAWSLLYYYRDYEKAIKDIDKITEMSGTTFNVCWGEDCTFQKGQALYRLGRFEEAIRAFNLSMDDLKRNGLDIQDEIYTFYYLGRCYQELGRWDEAVIAYDSALLSHSNFSEALFSKAQVYRLTNKFDLANKSLLEAEDLLAKNYKMGEPYFERFDELYPWMIEKEKEIQGLILKN